MNDSRFFLLSPSALLAISWLGMAHAQESACSGPGYMATIDAKSQVPMPPKGHGELVLRTPAVRVYEGAPWTNFALTRWNCVEEAERAVPKAAPPGPSGLPAFSVFASDVNLPTPSSERVPAGCAQSVYVIGTHEVIDPAQYAIYSKALGGAGARSFGMTLIFQGDKPLAQSRGSWPSNMQLALTQWPCAAAWDGFFLGKDYQSNVLPLRANAAKYRMGLYRPLDRR